MRSHILLTSLVLFYLSIKWCYSDGTNFIPNEKWGYINVRPKAHMFWWLYGAQNKEVRASLPLILWIQGGPGVSSTGYGNFVEIGPLDTDLRPRNLTWLSKANLLFIDNPVGAGFSYVEDLTALTKNISQITEDLFLVFSNILAQIPALRKTPFYIFCESYGGKMAAAFGDRLHEGIQRAQIECNFKGVALGDSWISPVDTTLTWGPYLYQFNLLDEKDLALVNDATLRVAKAVEMGDYLNATKLWKLAEYIIDKTTDSVFIFDVRQHHVVSPFGSVNDDSSFLYRRHVGVLHQQSLVDLMNGPIREKLGIIPENVKWGSQGDLVFQHQLNDFMKPVVNIVSRLISHGLKVVVYQGQFDMIGGTPGADVWIKKLDWPHLEKYLGTPRKPLYVGIDRMNTQGFVKTYDNFSLYYILNAGHMVPYANPEMAMEMLHRILTEQ